MNQNATGTMAIQEEKGTDEQRNNYKDGTTIKILKILLSKCKPLYNSNRDKLYTHLLLDPFKRFQIK